MSVNFIWRNDEYNKRVLIWRFTLVLIEINYGQIGDQTGLFYTTNPVFYTSGNGFVRRTGTFGNRDFFTSFLKYNNQKISHQPQLFTCSLLTVCI
jgi:hypothetical protein